MGENDGLLPLFQVSHFHKRHQEIELITLESIIKGG